MSWGFVAVAGATVVSGAMGSKAAGDAADTQAAAADRATQIQKDIYETNRALLSPFVSAAFGSEDMMAKPTAPTAPVMPTKPTAPQLQGGGAISRALQLSGAVDPVSRAIMPGMFGGGGRLMTGVAAPVGSQQLYDKQMADYNAAQAKYEQDLAQYEQDLAAYKAQPITGSYELQQAYSGALGPEMQAKAYQQYAESPGVAWAREQGMKGIESQLAASGRGGGTRLQAISEYNQGLAMQDFANQFNRLGAITGTALSAGQAIAGVGSAAGAGQAQAVLEGGAAQAGGIMGRSQALTSGISQLGQLGGMYSQMNQPTNYSGISGVNMGSQQDMMLAQQNAGLF